MSEAMSSGEIEDVLSSIRRLVSEDLRPASSSGGKPAARLSDAPAAPLPLSRIVAAETQTPEPKKLLLTPALRVVPAASAPETAPPPPTTAPRSADLTDVSEDPESVEDDGLFGAIDLKPRRPKQDMTEVVSTIATAVADADSQWESETGDASFEGLDWDTPLWEEDPTPTMADPRSRSVLAEAQTPVSEPPLAQEAHSPFTDADALEEAPVDLAEAAPEPEHVDPPAAEWEDAEASDPSLEDSLAAPQFSRRFVQDVSDRAEAEAVAEILRATQAEAEARVEPPDHRSDFGGGYESDRGADSDQPDNQGGYFDEAVLRDLVRDLIREELSGTLGERITRNVRKLVRAEIHRSLTARDLE
jgi:hypothetical protein